MSCYAFRNTVKFINVTGEEVGLLGSSAYAADAEQRGENILGVINMDMIGWEGDGSPDPENLDLNYNSASQWLAELFADCATRYATGLVVDAFYCPSLTASDHWPFWQRGWSAIVEAGAWLASNAELAREGGLPLFEGARAERRAQGAPALPAVAPCQHLDHQQASPSPQQCEDREE